MKRKLFYFYSDLTDGLCVFSMQCRWIGLRSVSMVFSGYIPSFVYYDIFMTWCYILAIYYKVYTYGLGGWYCEKSQCLSLFRRLFILI